MSAKFLTLAYIVRRNFFMFALVFLKRHDTISRFTSILHGEGDGVGHADEFVVTVFDLLLQIGQLARRFEIPERTA